jgi:cell division transport system ATP-binding protein
MIAFEQAGVRYRGGTQALEDVTLHFQPGELVAVVGGSGAGKTTLLKLLTREIRATSGRVVVDGVDLRSLSAAVLRLYREKLGIIFQDLRLIPHLTAIENAALPLELRGLDPREISLRLEAVFTHLGMVQWARSFPHTLSAGRQRLAAVARAVASEPSIVVADEPTDDLDPAQRDLVLGLLQRLAAQGATVIVGTHSPDIAAALGGRVIRLADGRVVTGPASKPAAVRRAPAKAPKPAPTPAAAPKVKITAIHSED